MRRLKDHPDVEDAWLEYLVNQLEPWAHEMRRWQDVQRVYERVDFMRRRLEEAEERYEVLLAVGLLQWRDPTAVQPVKRHLLTAPAEVSLDAARGVLTAAPAASFEKFWIELNMWISSTSRAWMEPDSMNAWRNSMFRSGTEPRSEKSCASSPTEPALTPKLTKAPLFSRRPV